MTRPLVVRCAIYTRKSSDEGLDQEFNSLQAQREACEAYVRSQMGQGWALHPSRYDDGGYSGGTLQRPALQRLLADVSAKRVDVIVVYKVDRLTRSLPDFVRIIEAFDRHDVSFVSITQAFNTTSSMGRLTLNMLLSFAQFEREVTGERIRDKIAASKAKGMWMGGTVPLGYDVPRDASRALVVNPTEAAQVRLMFAKFLELGNLPGLQRWLAAEGLRSKSRWRDGVQNGDCEFTSGALRHLLSSRVYLGAIVHKGAVHSGRHEPIVDVATFDAAQAVLASRRRTKTSRTKPSALMSGLVFDGDGLPMEAIVTQGRKAQLYRYYASQPLPNGSDGAPDDAVRRVPAYAINDLATDWTKTLLRLDEVTPEAVRALIGRIDVHASATHLAIRLKELPGHPGLAAALAQVRRTLKPTEQVLADPAHAGLIRILLPIRLVMRGGRKWLSDSKGAPLPTYRRPNPKLVDRLRMGHANLRACGIRPDAITPMVKTRAPKSPRQRQLAQLAFLAPDLQRRVFTGEIQSIALENVPLSWADQRRWVAQQETAMRNRTRRK